MFQATALNSDGTPSSLLATRRRPCHAKLQHPKIQVGRPLASPYSLGLQAGLRGPRAPSPLCLSVPVCRMGRHGGTSASCSYRGQPSLLTLAGGPAECGRQRPLTPSSPPSCPGSARGTQRDSETRAPVPRAAYDVHQTRGLRRSTLRPSGLAYSPRHSRRARARRSWLCPHCALRHLRPASLRRRRARKLGEGACAKRGRPCGLRRSQAT